MSPPSRRSPAPTAGLRSDAHHLADGTADDTPPAGLWQFRPLHDLLTLLYPNATTPVCLRCGADSTLTAYVAIVGDEVRCERCRARSTRALVVRLIAEDGYAVDRAEAMTRAMAS